MLNLTFFPLLALNKRWSEAGEWFKRCLDIDTHNLAALNAYGIALEEMGKLDEAETQFKLCCQV